ncbi:MAG: iron-containing alcohol dehydrogenase [Dehalococcoidales bacterium]
MVSRFQLTTEIIFGAGSIATLGGEAAKLGRKALLVTYPDIRRIGLLDKVLQDLQGKNIAVVIFDKVQCNPRTTTVDEGAEFARREKPDFFIGLGGGSVMDTTKGIAVTSAGSASVWDYTLHRAAPQNPIHPIIQVPTIAGTGSEMNPSAVLTHWESHIKMSLGGFPELQARVAIVDPALTLTVPMRQVKAGGVDILSHLIEYYLTDDTPHPLTDGISETGMKMVVEYLPRAIARPDDIRARTELSWASTVAMSKFARLGGGGGNMTCHAVEHALSGYYDVTHGEGLAALLPAWMRHFYRAGNPRFSALGKNVFGRKDGLEATEQFLESVGMRLRLGDLGCKLEDTQLITDLVFKSYPGKLALDADTVAQIYRDSF